MEKYQAIANNLLFSGLPEEEVAALAAIGREKSFGKGETIFFEGDEGNGLYIVMTGVSRPPLSCNRGDIDADQSPFSAPAGFRADSYPVAFNRHEYAGHAVDAAQAICQPDRVPVA